MSFSCLWFGLQARSAEVMEVNPQSSFLYEYLPQIRQLAPSLPRGAVAGLSSKPDQRISVMGKRTLLKGKNLLSSTLTTLAMINQAAASGQGVQIEASRNLGIGAPGTRSVWPADASAAALGGLLMVAAVEMPAALWSMTSTDACTAKVKTLTIVILSTACYRDTGAVIT